MASMLSRFTREVRHKFYGLALGLTLGLGAVAANQSCVSAGQ
jgi:hypothetical protein